jgi:hypothetical protein
MLYMPTIVKKKLAIMYYVSLQPHQLAHPPCYLSVVQN